MLVAATAHQRSRSFWWRILAASERLYSMYRRYRKSAIATTEGASRPALRRLRKDNRLHTAMEECFQVLELYLELSAAACATLLLIWALRLHMQPFLWHRRLLLLVELSRVVAAAP